LAQNITLTEKFCKVTKVRDFSHSHTKVLPRIHHLPIRLVRFIVIIIVWNYWKICLKPKFIETKSILSTITLTFALLMNFLKHWTGIHRLQGGPIKMK
jgi:hypothetical protein